MNKNFKTLNLSTLFLISKDEAHHKEPKKAFE